MISDQIKAVGKLTITLKGEDGQIKDQRELNNLVVTTGKNFIAARMKDGAGAQMSHMAIGTGTSAAAAGDTALGTEVARSALATAGGSVAGAVVTYSASFAAGTGTGAITEAGILNASSSGTLLCRTVFSAVNKSASDAMTINWTVTIQ